MAESQPRIPTPNDFLTQWRQMAEQTETQWNQYFNQVMGTDAFAGMMGRSMEAFLSVQQSLASSVERYLQAMNVPTRNDISALGERLAAIESQLSLLTAEQQRLIRRLPDAEDGGSKRGGKGGGNGSGS